MSAPAVDSDTMDKLVQHACFAADRAAMGDHRTGAERTRAVVRASLDLLLGNGLISVAPVADWPEYVALDPPYKMPWG